ncbi:MAG: ATP-binding protein [Acidimicrobiales bacterium]
MFEHELANAEALETAGHSAAALAAVGAALQKRRGIPFADLGDWPGVLVERTRLEERFCLAEELMAELRMEHCPSDSLLGDLEGLVARAPLRERRWWLMIEASRRAGRSAQALAIFERARTAMIGALGAEPGPALQAQYHQLLTETAPIDSTTRWGPSPVITLPVPRSSFVGRAVEVERLLGLIGRERLLTLVGVGGSGKTRLAIEVGHRWALQQAEPVGFADLTAVADPSGLVGAVAVAAGLGTGYGNAHPAELGAQLRGHSGLLVLDNAEHLLGGLADLVDQILEAAPFLRLVVTSREPLAVDGERRWPVGPLSGGPDGDAVALFLARAQARRPDFPCHVASLQDVTALCEALDGLPLALELAAGWVDVLSPADLRGRLRAEGDLPTAQLNRLSPSPRSGGRRFTSIDAALRWSTETLPPELSIAFHRLAVLPDGFGLSAAGRVCGLSDEQVLPVIESLLDKSLVSSAYRGGSVRFRMLDTVRRHARAGLAGLPPAEVSAHDGLLRWAAATARRYWELASEGRHRVAMELGDLEQQNLRAALDWAAESGSVADGVIVMCRMEDWWRSSGHTFEAWERLRHLLDRAQREPVPERLWLEGVICLAAFATFAGDPARSEISKLIAPAERKLDQLSDRRLALRLATQLAWISLELTDVGTGPRLRDLLAESRRLGGLMESSLLFHLAYWQLSHSPIDALATAADCETAADRNGNGVSRAHAAEVHGLVLTANGQLAAARDRFAVALDGLTAGDSLGCVLHCMESVAWWAASRGHTEAAQSLLGLALGIRRVLRRVRNNHEAFGYAAAVACCGEPTPASGSDLVATAVALARQLLGVTVSVDPQEGAVEGSSSTSLSRPAWL